MYPMVRSQGMLFVAAAVAAARLSLCAAVEVESQVAVELDTLTKELSQTAYLISGGPMLCHNRLDQTPFSVSGSQLLCMGLRQHNHTGEDSGGTGGILWLAVTAVLQTLSMAGIGLIFGRLGIIDANVRKVLSTVSMKIMIPCLLFSSMLDCPQGGPAQDRALCPELSVSIRCAWPLFVLPILWVAIGMGCGALAAKMSGAPRELHGMMMAACAFSNSTGLPITLLSALSTATIGGPTVDPQQQNRNFLLLLSIYQVLYPMIQWTVGGRLLAGDEVRIAVQDGQELGLSDPSLSMSPEPSQARQRAPAKTHLEFAKDVLRAALVPPVIAVLASFFISIVHYNGRPVLKDIFVDTYEFDNDRPLEWMFNAILMFGKAAVPLNMLVLGAGLGNIPNMSTIHWPSTMALVFAKLVLCPALGFLIVYVAYHVGFISFVIPDPGGVADFILVACLLCATPTANNLTIMAEVSGGAKCKAALTSSIFVMYCFAPFLLTAWIVLFVSFAQSVPAA